MKLLKRLELKDKKIFEKFLALQKHKLCAYSFQDIYIWKGLFDIRWAIIQNSLCVFFEDKIGCFLYLPPLAEKKCLKTIAKVFRIMDQFNQNKAISRIENVEKNDLDFYQRLGYEYYPKSPDYLCQRRDLVELRGDRFKSKRSAFNYFIRNYNFRYLPYSKNNKNDCLGLYREWMQERQVKNNDKVYQGMLSDNFIALRILLKAYKNLDLLGRVVEVNGKIRAFTFGFKLNKEIFCILYEIADLSLKGLAQFIFRSFCSDLKDFRHINIMDDSGLENLKQAKLSYRPVKLIPNFIVQRKK